MADLPALSVLPGRLAVCRLPARSDLPAGLLSGSFVAVTRTAEELSVVCAVELAPAAAQVVGPWRAIKVAGPLDFALTGILAGLSSVLAGVEISLFAISTFDTDYILVREPDLEPAIQALANRGYSFLSSPLS